jgi:hypothetical protein
MRQLLTASLLGTGLVVATSLLAPSDAAAGACNGTNRVFPNCRVPAGVPTEPSVPEPGAAALFALGAGLVAARTRRQR